MKLIALHSFRNVGGKIKVEGALHANHIERGQTFSIGEGQSLKESQRTDERSAELCARLLLAGVASEPTPEVVAKVQAETEQDRKRELHLAEMDRAAQTRAVAAQFTDLIAQAARLVQPATPARAR